MKVSKLTIHNYRSICDIEMLCEPLVVMLGPNNHGKSNILHALEFALSTSSKPAVADFCKFKGNDNVLWVELTFHHLTQQEQNTFNVKGHHYSPTWGQDNSPTPCGRKRFKIGGNAPRRKRYVGEILPASFLRCDSPLS